MISPLAYVDPEAKLGKNVTVLPFAYIEKNVEIGDDCVIMSYASILQGTKMGKGNKVHQNAVLGAEPQDFHYTGEESSLIIGDNNDIRENVVISRATFAGNATKIGNGNYLMDKVHLCHDVQILFCRRLSRRSAKIPNSSRTSWPWAWKSTMLTVLL